MDKLEQHILKIEGAFDGLFMQGVISDNLHKYLGTGLSLINQAAQEYKRTKPWVDTDEIERDLNRYTITNSNTKDEHLQQIAKELENCVGWMKDSSAGSVEVTLDELIEDNGDIYEVVVDIHLNNGEVVTLRNNCVGGLEKGEYVGDYMDDDFSDGNMLASFCVNGKDGNFHQMKIPLTSISWIDSYSVDVDWEKYKLSKEQ